MQDPASTFDAASSQKAHDKEHRRKINFNIGRYNAVVPQGKQQFPDIEVARAAAKYTKWQAIETLDRQLQLFESKITARGAKVLWSETAEEALAEILKICQAAACTTVVKSKSMVTEELHLNAFLEKAGIDSVETDLGEYIQQLDGEPPYHIVTPAMHKSKEDVARLFAEKLGTPPNLTPTELTLVARKNLREKYREAQVGITGANFIIPDIGGVALTENEGNGRLSCAYPKVHIVIVGIEKALLSIKDLALFWPLLSTFGTGQQVTVYNSIITGPRQSGEEDGPEEMYVILLDNGRTNLLLDPALRESLYCIRCGACLNACPVYKNIGGHAYGTTYSGPIGSVITPHLRDMGDWKHLSHASSLCGNCTEVCPVGISLHNLLLTNRKKGVENGHGTLREKIAWGAWKSAMMDRRLMNTGSGRLKSFMVNRFVSAWTKSRGAMTFPKKSFNELWRDQTS